MRLPRLSKASLIGMCLALFALAPAWAATGDIHAAVRSGDAQKVAAALDGGSGIDSADNWGRTPLIVALQQGKTPVVELLLQRGASVAATDAWGRTPLLVATQLKNMPAIRLLLDRKVDVNAANKNDITPLIAAAQTGNQEAVRLLLEAGAAPGRRDNLGYTALMWAAYRKDDAMVKLLREMGADAAESRPSMPAPVASGAAPELFPVVDAQRIVRGNPKAVNTIFEYTDFQCPYCRQGAKVIDEVMARYEGQIRLILKHLPLPLLHPMAMSCALYFEAISLQGADKAWAYYDRIFLDQRALGEGEPYLQRVAAELGVDMKRLEQDLRSQVVRDRIAADLKESERYKFDGVPAFVVNGKLIAGAQPAQSFFELIDAVQRK